MNCGLLSWHPDRLWCGLVIYLAGLAAEGMVYGRFRSGEAAEDLGRARDLAVRIVASGRKCPAGLRARSWPVAFAAMFEAPLGEKELRVLQIGYDAARSLLVRRKSDHAHLTARLLAHRHVSATMLRTWYGPRVFVRVAGVVGRGTFL